MLSRLLAAMAGGVLLSGITPAAFAAGSPADIAAVLRSLDGRSCHGDVEWGADSHFPKDSPAVVSWFHRADGVPMIKWQFLKNPAADLPVTLLPDAIRFVGVKGTIYTLRGDAAHLTGPARDPVELADPGYNGTLTLSCEG